MCIPWPTHRGTVLLEHRVQDAQAGADHQLEELGLGVDQQLDERQ
jgi:hypothetical protein